MAILSPAAGNRADGGGRCRRAGWLVAWLLTFLLAVETLAQSSQLREYQIKAVFLYNFAHFVEWPAPALADPSDPLVIGVLGQDPFGPLLDEAVAGEKIDQHPLIVRRFRRVDEIDRCHVLFVSSSENDRLAQTFAQLKGRSILVVGESEGFAKRGGMIRFVTEKNKVRLRVNLEAARAAGLVISSKLLRPAEIVTP